MVHELARPRTDLPGGGAGLTKGVLVLVAAVGAVLVLGVGSATALTVAYRGDVLPGTLVRGVDVGGLSEADVVAKLAPRAADLEARSVVFTAPAGATLPVTASEVGYRVDLEATAAAALRAGRDGNLLQRLWSSLSAPWSDRTVTLAESLDETALTARVDALATAADRPVVRGGVVVKGTAVAVTAPGDGFATDQAATVAQVREALGDPAPAPRPLPGITTPARVDPQSVAAAGDLARRIVAAPLELAAGTLRTTVPARTLGGLLTAAIVPGEGLRTVRLTLDDDGLTKAVVSATEPLLIAARSVALQAAGPPPLVESQGDLTFAAQPASVSVTAPSTTGRGVDVPATMVGLADLVLAGGHTAPVVLVVAQPTVTSTQAAEVTQLIATFTTSYAAGQPRGVNIARIADLVAGTVIPAGGKFSLNGVAGERTPEKGFVKDSAILGGELVDQFGGGVSQFSTTMFNAAFFAGLPINSYQAHSFYISRYPAGRESTLNFPTIDMSWTNDTGHPVLVATSHTPTSVTVALYGDSGGRVVSSTTGERVAQPTAEGGGFTIRVTRTIRGGGADGTRTFTTRYVDPPKGE